MSLNKREGDGATPVGYFPLRRVFYRPDRIVPPATRLPLIALSQQDGWCDDPLHPAYNTLVTLPFTASHEVLWREDTIYDIIIEVGYNDSPVEAGRGSAIFIHLMRPDGAPTEGCVAFGIDDILTVLAALRPDSQLITVAMSAPP